MTPMPENRILLKPLVDTNTGIFCHLLQIDNTKIIINCGIGPELDYSIYDSVRDIIESAECILLTSFDLCYMGAVGLFREMEIFCTIPTAVLGKIVLDELHSYFGEKLLNVFQPKQIKYSQPFQVKDLEIVSYNAGNIIGNCVFRITKDMESISIGYNFNHRKEYFLNGIDHSGIENTTVLVTNTRYADTPIHSLKSRDEMIHEIVENRDGQIIFSVSYSRLFELLCILSKYKISVVSRNGKIFTERVKSMVEWAGSKAQELLSQLDIEFLKINELKDQKIIVLINEFHPEGYLGTVLERLNNQNNTLVLLDNRKSSIRFSDLKIFSYTYRKKEIIEEIDILDLKDEKDEDIEIEHWSKYSKVFFINETLDYRDQYPHAKRRRYNNEYGEAVNFKFERKIEESSLKLPKPREIEEIEDRTLQQIGLVPEIDIVDYDLYGCSDFTSFKTVCESSNCKSIVFVEENKLNAEFLEWHFKTSRLKISSHIARGLVTINYSANVQKITVSDKIMSLPPKDLFQNSITHFKASRRDNMLEYTGDCPSIVLGIIGVEGLKKSLIEDGFQVEAEKDGLLVNDSLKIEFFENKLYVKGVDIDLLVAVRKIIYKHLVIV